MISTCEGSGTERMQHASGSRTPTNSDSTPPDERLGRLAAQLDAAISALAEARPFAKSRYQTEVLRLASDLIDSFAGLQTVHAMADRLEAAGLFHGGPWSDVSKLLPRLVRGCLLAQGQTPLFELLSELRVLAIASGRAESEQLSRKAAHGFLRSVIAFNLDLL